MTTLANKIGTRSVHALAAFALVLSPVAVPAKSATELSDLVGSRAAGGESDLEARGWVSVSGHKDGDSSYTYWWNGSRKDCVRVTTRDGRYASITDTGAGDCNQKSGGGNNGAVTAAVAAAAILGVVALSHKSHHRNDKEHQDPQDLAEFERGHRDGLYNHSYRNDRRSDDYSDGYQSGVNERNEQSSYRPEYRDSQRNQYAGGGSGSAARQVTCASSNGRYKECRLDGGGDIVMKTQLSKTDCVKNKTWGETADGVYVNGGCRAVFETIR